MDRRWTWLFLVLVLLAASAFFTKGLWPVDETRYAEVGREVLSQNSIFLLTKNAEPYSHKPPLYPWLMAIGYWIFGVHDWIPKVIPLLASLGCVWAGGKVYQELYRTKVPGVYKVVLLSSLYYFLFSFYAMFDVLLTFWVLLAAYFYLQKGYLRFWAMLGLGILTKGPVILVVIGLPVLIHLVSTKGWKSLKPTKQFWVGLALMLGIVGIWLIPLVVFAEGDFIRELLLKQNFGRMAGAGSWAHERPLYWYVFLFPVLAGPWALFWYANGYKKRFRSEFGDQFINIMVGTNLIAFSLISGKQMHYLIPVIPFLAMWIARHGEQLFITTTTSIVQKCYAIISLVGGLIFIWLGGGVQGYWKLSDSIFQTFQEYPPLIATDSIISLSWVPVGILLLLIGAVGLLKYRFSINKLTWVTVASITFLAWLTLALVPAADQVLSPKKLSQQIAGYIDDGRQVGVFDTGTYDATFNFYAGHDHFPVLDSTKRAEEFLARSPKPLLVVREGNELLTYDTYEKLNQGWAFGYRYYIIQKESD